MEPTRGPHAARLAEVMAQMTFCVHPAPFALVGLPGPRPTIDVAAIEAPGHVVFESDETTVLLREAQLEAFLQQHPLHGEPRIRRGLRWIRFDAPMGWDIVGFLASVATRLAAAEVPLGVVCSFLRDHLFVGADELERTSAALGTLCPQVPWSS